MLACMLACMLVLHLGWKASCQAEESRGAPQNNTFLPTSLLTCPVLARRRAGCPTSTGRVERHDPVQLCVCNALTMDVALGKAC